MFRLSNQSPVIAKTTCPVIYLLYITMTNVGAQHRRQGGTDPSAGDEVLQPASPEARVSPNEKRYCTRGTTVTVPREGSPLWAWQSIVPQAAGRVARWLADWLTGCRQAGWWGLLCPTQGLLPKLDSSREAAAARTECVK